MTEDIKDPFFDAKIRADIIDAVIRLLIVSRDGKYDRHSKSTYDQYAVRSAVAMALALYIDRDEDMIETMNKLQSRD